MKLSLILSAVILSLLGMLCNKSAGMTSHDAYDRLRSLHVECEKAYMRNDFYQMKIMLDRSIHILDSLKRSGESPAAMSEAYALLYKDAGSYYYCIADMDIENYQHAWTYYMSALAVYEEYDDDPLKKASINTELAQLCYKAGAYNQALAFLEANLSTYEKGWDDAAFRTLSEIALCKARLHRFEEALNDVELAIMEGGKFDGSREMIRKKGKILALQAEAENGSFRKATDCFRVYFEAQRDSVTANFSRMKSDERERYWLRMHSFITDCYRIGNEDAGLLYDITLFSKNILLQFSDKRNAPIGLTWKDIQSNLDKDETAIEFICYETRGDSHIGAIVLNQIGRPVFKEICHTETLLSHTLNGDITVRDALESCNEDYKDVLYQDDEIRNIIWRELEDETKDAQRIYFSPDGVLHLIAIEYLYPEYNAMKPEFHRLTGTRELARERKEIDIGKMLLCGGIDFYYNDIDMSDISHENDRLAYNLLKDISPYFTYLPDSKMEVDTIFALRTDPDDYILSGGQATESECRRTLNDYPVVMLSTHGYFGGNIGIRDNDLVPCLSDIRLSESVLILAGAQKNIEDDTFDTTQEDGILSARELSMMDLGNIELFIASACQSGLGQVTADGVYGIQRGLKNGGVKAMIVSLWNVNDEATRYFMINLNAALKNGENLHAAFEYAREKMDEEVSYEKYIYHSGKMRGEYVRRKDARFSLPRYKNAFILIDNI